VAAQVLPGSLRGSRCARRLQPLSVSCVAAPRLLRAVAWRLLELCRPLRLAAARPKRRCFLGALGRNDEFPVLNNLRAPPRTAVFRWTRFFYRFDRPFCGKARRPGGRREVQVARRCAPPREAASQQEHLARMHRWVSLPIAAGEERRCFSISRPGTVTARGLIRWDRTAGCAAAALGRQERNLRPQPFHRPKNHQQPGRLGP